MPASISSLILFFSLLSIVSAQGDKGGLSGAVVDRDFDFPLSGATVTILSSGEQLTTDKDGRFLFPALDTGTTNVAVAREGFVQELRQNVTIQPGRVTDIRVSLLARVVEMEGVSAQVEDLKSEEDSFQLAEIKTNIDSVVNVLGADFISKSTSSDAAGLLTKTVGTSVTDGKFVVVRGLSDRYNTVFLNGARIPSSDPDRRAVTVDIFPSSLISSLSNTKTFSVENPGESTGGHINIRLKSVPDEDFVKFGFSYGYNTNTTGRDDFIRAPDGGIDFLGRSRELEFPSKLDKLITSETLGSLEQSTAAKNLLDRPFGVTTGLAGNDFNFSFSAGKRGDFGEEGTAGILFATTYDMDYQHNPDTILGRARVGTGGGISQTAEFFGSESEQSLLAGILVSGGIEFDDDNEISLTFFTNRAIEDEAGFFLGNDEDGGSIGVRPIQDQTDFQVREYSRYTERRLRTYQAAGEHIFPDKRDTEIDWNATYSQSSQNEPDFRLASYRPQTVPMSFFSPERRQYTPPFTSGNVVGEPIERIWRRLDDTNYNLNLNGRIPLTGETADDKSIDLKIGGGFDRSTRIFDSNTYAYSFSRPVNIDPAVSFSDISPDNRKFRTLADNIAEQSVSTNVNEVTPFIVEILEGYDASQNIASFYTGIDTPINNRLDISFGARVEKFDLQVQAAPSTLPAALFLQKRFYLTDPETGEVFPEDAPVNIDSTDVLPVFSVNYKPRKNMAIRVVGSRTVARPTFKEIAPVLTRDPTGKLFIGNRFLKTSTASNMDVRWEWLRDGKNLVAITGFTKRIEDPIELADLNAFVTARNEKEATVYGFEIEFNQNLEDFSPLTRHFSVGSNFTKIFSSVTLGEESAAIRDPGVFETPRRLAGQPDYILNFNLNYNNPDIGVDAGLFLNTTGELISRVGGADSGGDIFPDVLKRPFTTLDFAFSKRFLDNWKLTIKARNLTREVRAIEYADGTPFDISNDGIDYSIGISGEF